ncbi:MAG: hypothetical protein EBU84_11005 [Actinobacteria bacterium]|nr:hypothetical protein [Actinomycetota bacterium]
MIPQSHNISANEDRLVAQTLASLPDDITGFREASQLYGSEFFADETPSFKQKLCLALRNKYQRIGNNNFWNANSSI